GGEGGSAEEFTTMVVVWRKMGCGDGEDGDMGLMIDSVVMWMMVEGGVARLEWPEISPDNGREEWEAPDCYRERGMYII
ncbi:hypothetical protein Tco_1545742, partial [Tanacetum coccineum]